MPDKKLAESLAAWPSRMADFVGAIPLALEKTDHYAPEAGSSFILPSYFPSRSSKFSPTHFSAMPSNPAQSDARREPPGGGKAGNRIRKFFGTRHHIGLEGGHNGTACEPCRGQQFDKVAMAVRPRELKGQRLTQKSADDTRHRNSGIEAAGAYFIRSSQTGPFRRPIFTSGQGWFASVPEAPASEQQDPHCY